MKVSKKRFNPLKLLLVTMFFALSTTAVIYAQNPRNIDLEAILNGTEFFDPFGDSSCSAAFGTGDFTRVSTEILERLSQNEEVYRAASQETGVPWEVIATLHYRESSGRVVNPAAMSEGPLAGRGQGVYQLFSSVLAGEAGPFPPGPITQEEFLEQSILAAEFLLTKDATRRRVGVTGSQPLLPNGNDPRVIKELFFYYNGAANVYIEQALRIGRNDPWEGSPYVVNFATPQQSPDNFPDWQQVRTDGGDPERANGEPGAFLVYSALSGQTCDNPDGSGVLDIAQEQLAMNVAEDEPGEYSDEILQYTQGNEDIPWGPAFVSWVYNQAGNPLEAGNGDWLIPTGEALLDNFTVNDAFFTANQDVPQAGDVLFIETPSTNPLNRQINVFIVDRIEGTALWAIGGDVGDAVAERQFANYLQNADILGFGSQNVGGDVDDIQVLPINPGGLNAR